MSEVGTKKVYFINKKFLLLTVLFVIFVVFLLLLKHNKVVVYHNCNQLQQAGHSNIPKDSSLYQPQLDSDKDGIACER